MQGRSLIISVLLTLPARSWAENLPLKLPSPPVKRDVNSLQHPRIPILKGQIQRAKIFAAYRELISIYEANGFYAESAALHREQAGLYRAKKYYDAATIEDMRAAEVDTDLRLFIDKPIPASATGPLYTGAPLEPILGCYSGAYISHDDSLGESHVADGQIHRSPSQLEQITGIHPSNLFIYWKYGRPFPSNWVRELKAQNCIPNLALEPKDIRQVKDDAYLQTFASDLAAADWPVFIRFASEMNGFWTPYHSNPELYKEKFRLVYRVLHAKNPSNVALIWCVGNPPLTGIEHYYPGDNFVDWVGVNIYSVPWHENQRTRPAFRENPLSLLQPIYARYAAKKPIAVCEFAASHQSVVDKKLIPDFAVEKLSLVYGAIPLLYPRVKLIDWFSMNTIEHAVPGKTLNNYLLGENPSVRNSWASEHQTPWYLPKPQTLSDSLPPAPQPFRSEIIPNEATVRVWSKCHSSKSRCWLEVDGKLITGQRKTGAWSTTLPNLTPGKHNLRVLLYDDSGRFMDSKQWNFHIQTPPAPLVSAPYPSSSVPSPQPEPDSVPAPQRE